MATPAQPSKKVLKERQLFDIVRAHLLPDLDKADDQFSIWDCVSHDRGMVVELKCRADHYGELLLEKRKYDDLMAKAADLGYIPVYINSTPAGLFAWRLDTQILEWHERAGLPRTSEFEDNEKIVKVVSYLPTRGAKVNAWHLPEPHDTELRKRD